MTYLIVVAHPDDEVLGAGATIYKKTHAGDDIDLCIMSTTVLARSNRPTDKQLSDDVNASSSLLGVRRTYKGVFPNIEMNTVPHLQLVQFIEKTIEDSKPDIIITHHPSDTNNDHFQTSSACQAAIRLFQRRPEIKPVTEFWFMEVPSSTEWSVDVSCNRFQPNLFIEVGSEGIEKKLNALTYDNHKFNTIAIVR